MMIGILSQGTVEQNLRDAGCSEDAIGEFLVFQKKGQIQEQLKLLSRQRRLLLDQIHREERQIECLDYLVYQIRKESEKKRQEGETEDE